MTEMFLTIKKNGQEIAFSSEEVENLIDQLDDMMGELALMEESEKDSIPEEIPVDMPSVQEDKPRCVGIIDFHGNWIRSEDFMSLKAFDRLN